MDLYTLTETFLADAPVDQYVSAIWTERYTTAGDVQLVVPATTEAIEMLSAGTYLALRGSKEVMILETQKIEKGLLTVQGRTLPVFLNERFAWFANPDSAAADSRVVDYAETNTPGEIMASLVDKMVINTVAFAGTWAPANLQWADDEIPFLTMGTVDTSGADQRFQIPIGPLYDAIETVAKNNDVGFSLYLASADPITGYSLKFTTYRGVDRTSDQVVNPLIRLSPDMDTLTDLNEINSIQGYKNVVYVYFQGIITTHYADPLAPVPEGLQRRVIVVNAEGMPSTYRPGYALSAPEITAFREQTAKDAFANHNYIRAVDGKTSPIDDYKYGVDYGLGDVIELEGITGTLSKARVTEYIRSQDQTGEKDYPSITVVT